MKKIFTMVFLFASYFTMAAALPAGFVEKLLAQNLDPTDMVLTPDGRILISVKSGKILIVDNDVLLATPLLNIESLVDNTNERGLGHIVLDPNFATNGYYYLYFTVKGQPNNRISRFTAVGNTSNAASQLEILTLNALASTIHNAGDMVFASDGKLFVSVGEGGLGSNAQSTGNLLGKVLRINSDGTVPTDNPFYNDASFVGINKAIYALGLRNPFSMDIQPGTGKVFVCDVGQADWEEVNYIEPGKNYGWPSIEGKRASQPLPTVGTYQDPLLVYPHNGVNGGCSIVGSAFYNPATVQFPASYNGRFFYADYCGGYIKTVSPTNGNDVQSFATGVNRPLCIIVGQDGTLYYIARGGVGGGDWGDNQSSTNGTLWKVTYTGVQSPSISANPQDKAVAAGTTANFIIAASGAQPLSYQWQVNQVNIPGATAVSYSFNNAQPSDNGKKFRCIVTNTFGTATSTEATLTVTANTPPEPQISWSLSGGGSLYQGGQNIIFSGTATDAEGPAIPDDNLTWKIDFHHDTHTHPALDATTGAGGSLFIPKVGGETSPNVWYRIYLTATDNGTPALSKTVQVDIYPQKSDITLISEPAGQQLLLDGQTVTAPYTFTSVVNITRDLSAAETVTINGVPHQFDHWSEAGSPRSFSFDVPAANKTFTAVYVPSGDIPTIIDQPQSVSASVGKTAVFTVSASGTEPLSYQWQSNGVNIADATTNTYTLTNVQLSDSGKKFKCVVTNIYGVATSQEATLTVNANVQPVPVIVITLPGGETNYRAGDKITFEGTATDPEDGELPASVFSWKVDLHHDVHAHTVLGPLNGVQSGSYTIPQVGETSDNVWYRVYLTVTDNGTPALSTTTYVDIQPKKIDIAINTEPAGLPILLDGQPITTPQVIKSVVGVIRKLEAPAAAQVGAVPYRYDHWSGPEDRVFVFNTPENNRNFTAYYVPDGDAPAVSLQPTPVSTSIGGNAIFYIEATGTDPLTYQWQVNGVDAPDGNSQLYSIFNAQLSDNGKLVRCVVTNLFGTVTSNEVLLTVSPNAPPVPDIQWSLSDGALQYKGGSILSFNGTAVDPEQGNLPPSTMTLRVDFNYSGNTVTVFGPVSGISEGTYTIPKTGEASVDGFYRIYLTAADNGSPAESTTTYKDVLPLKSDITLATEPAGLKLLLNNQEVTAPYTFTSVVNKTLLVEAPEVQRSGTIDYIFSNWTDGATRKFSLDAPETNQAYMATYAPLVMGDGNGLMGYYYTNQDKTFEGAATKVRLDPVINFTWTAEPIEGVTADHFTVRWMGEVLPQFTDNYTFYMMCNDGVRLWVNKTLLIDQWTNQNLEWTGTIALTAGTKYPIKIEYYDNVGEGVAQLFWSTSKLGKQVIPATQLSSDFVTAIPGEASFVTSLYPTVTEDKIRIEWNGGRPAEWTIVNAMGNEVMSGATKAKFEIQVEHLASGLYLFKVGEETLRFIRK